MEKELSMQFRPTIGMSKEDEDHYDDDDDDNEHIFRVGRLSSFIRP